MSSNPTSTEKARGLDLGCGAGGCSVGYQRAGINMTGVDLLEHPEYPYELIVGDMLTYPLDGFDFVHVSPPCPRYSTATPAHRRHLHPDLIDPMRERLTEWGGVWVIENVPGAPLRSPVKLCGSSFGLRVRRHRLFESNVMLMVPPCQHRGHAHVGVYGDHADRPGGWLRPNGTSRGVKATSVADAQDALGVDWMSSWDDLADSVPPAYTAFLGEQLLSYLALSGVPGVL